MAKVGRPRSKVHKTSLTLYIEAPVKDLLTDIAYSRRQSVSSVVEGIVKAMYPGSENEIQTQEA
jgi:hypothetical protein